MISVDVAIVGAGFAGLAMALRLHRDSDKSFVVLERHHGVGGTWRDNTYPGLTCDVPAHLYTFADHPNPQWSALFPSGPEIRDYLVRTAHEHDLDGRILFNTPLTKARWTADHWEIESAGQTIVHAEYLVLCCGRLTSPRVPQIAGLGTFPGPMFHSARWDHDAELAGADVAVVGTGASAVQIVPEVARLASRVTVFQRTPGWIVPRGNRSYSAVDRRSWTEHPERLTALRQDLFNDGEARFASRSGDPAAAHAARQIAMKHLHLQVADPVLREQLTPTYDFGCKRVLLSDDFYPTLQRPSVSLEPSALSTIDGHTLVAGSGRKFRADVLILATGFETQSQPYSELIEGESGSTLAEHWSHGMTSVGSTLVNDFPSLFVINGPNASLGHNSAVLMIEEQVQFILRLMRSSSGPIRVTEEAEVAYTREIDRRAAGTPWVDGGCSNWYVDERSGRLTLLWPGVVSSFHQQLNHIAASHFSITR